METSKEMKLKIIDKMRKNIEDNIHMMSGIEYEVVGKWYEVKNSLAHVFNMNVMKYRLKPETITINGVDIPKPLEYEDIASDPEKIYYVVSCCGRNYIKTIGTLCIDQGYRFVYSTRQEAITTSRNLFGMMKQ